MSDPPARRTVTTGSRLHFGPLTWPGPLDDPTTRPDFGGVGLMVDAPATRVTATPADDWSTLHDRPRLVEALASQPQRQPPRQVTIDRAAPGHIGLGSGTQRELAIAAACGLPVEAAALAAATGRGRRSAIGVHGFCRGGFLIDGGRPDGEPLGRLAHRVDFPDWPLHLVRLSDRVGLFGPAEARAFETLRPMEASRSERLHTLADAMLAAVASVDRFAFAAALIDYGLLVGEFFAPTQHGRRLLDPGWDDLLPQLAAQGCGVAQSSWGPTVLVVGEFDPDLLAGAHAVRPVRPRNTPAAIVDGSTSPADGPTQPVDGPM